MYGVASAKSARRRDEAFGIAVADCHDLRIRVVAIATEVQICDAAETDNADADHGAKAVLVRRYSRR